MEEIMENIINFMNSYGVYCFLSLYLILFIFLTIFLWKKRVKQYNDIVKLFNENEVAKCYDKINSLIKYTMGYNKQFLLMYLAMALIGEKKYSLALEKIALIDHKRLEKTKMFWKCFALICLDEKEQAKIILTESIIYKDEIDYKVLETLLLGRKFDEEVYSKIKSGIIIQYISENAQKYE